jgi:dTMP kinase
MKKGKFVVFEGIYGSGRLIVELVAQLREALTAQGTPVYEIDSPDGGRAQLMGAQELDSSWRYGDYHADFFFELASRARVCSVIREETGRGKLVLCKHFTLSSIVYAELKGHDWFREDLNVLEARARGLQLGGEVTPDLTVFVDLPPDAAIRELGDKLGRFFQPADLVRQQRLYKEEIAKLRSPVRTIAGLTAPALFPEVLAAIQSL